MSGQVDKITEKQARILKLLFKFRFINTKSLADVIKVDKRTIHYSLENLVSLGLVNKVYESTFKIQHKPAYYYLSKSGVTAVRGLMKVKESVVNSLYKDENASPEFIEHCQTVLKCYAVLQSSLPSATNIFTRTEINRFNIFPKNKPDMYVRGSDKQELIIYVMNDQPNYIINKRIDEIITHSEDEGWEGDYPIVALVLKDQRTQKSVLYRTKRKLDDMGFEEDELTIIATSLEDFVSDRQKIWSSSFSPLQTVELPGY